MTRIHLSIAASLLLCSLLIDSGASATPVCTLGVSGVNFGGFNPLTGNSVDIPGSITVNCTDVTSYAISLSTGGGSYSSRRMVSGGSHHLDYNLYRDAAYQLIWGDGSNGSYTVTLSNPVNGQDNVHVIYGRIPLAGQRAAHVGSYNDSITVTVTY